MRGVYIYKTTGITMKNTLSTNNNGGVYCSSVSSGYVMDYNDVWNNKGSSGTSKDYNGCAPTGTHSLIVDPQYTGTGVNEMEKHILKSTSPVLKAGENGVRMGWIRPADIVMGSEPIKMVNGVFYAHVDHLQSSSVVIDSAGTIKQLSDYYPYGSIRFQQEAEDFETDHLYTGQELDEEFGLYYYGARYYHPIVGRFASQDPAVLGLDPRTIIDPQSQNAYAYARNNPVIFVDPDGRAACRFLEFWCIDTAKAPGVLPGTTADDLPDNTHAAGDFVPISGDISDIYALFSGKTLFSGESVETADKFFILVGVVLPGLTSSQLKITKELIPWIKESRLKKHYDKHHEALEKFFGREIQSELEYQELATDFLRKREGNFEFYFDNVEKSNIKYDRATEEFAAFSGKKAQSYFLRTKGEFDKLVEKGRFKKLEKDPAEF